MTVKNAERAKVGAHTLALPIGGKQHGGRLQNLKVDFFLVNRRVTGSSLASATIDNNHAVVSKNQSQRRRLREMAAI